MTKHWKESMKLLRRHVDPEMEEKLRCTKLETENKVKRSLKLIKSINQNRDGNLKKKAELTHLVEDIQKEYQSIYTLYDNLRGEVREKFPGEDESGSSSTSNSDTEEYYTPEELNGASVSPIADHQKVNKKSDNRKCEDSDPEDAILKDKLTSTSELKKIPSVDSLVPLNEVPESSVVFKDLRIHEEQTESMKQKKLQDECAQLKEKLNEKEEEIVSITKRFQAFVDQKMFEIDELQGQVISLNLELETVTSRKREFEEKVKTKTNEAKQMRMEKSRQELRIRELESLSKEKETQMSSLLEKFEEDKSKFEDIMARSAGLQLEVVSLSSQKRISEEQLMNENEKRSNQVTGLVEQVKLLQQQLDLVSSQKFELELQLENKSQEASECLVQMEKTNDKLTDKAIHGPEITEGNECLKVKVEELEQEISRISGQKTKLEDQIISTRSEANHLRVENENLYRRIFVLETTVKDRENELSTLERKFETRENEISTQLKSLEAQINNTQQKLEILCDEKSRLQIQLEQEKKLSSESLSHIESKNTELTNKIADQQKALIGLDEAMSKLNVEHKQVQGRFDNSKSGFQIAERKIEEMAEEFFKKCEDNLRILSRRIRVAEQLHVENKEWYEKTKNRYEQQNKELKERLENNKVWLGNIKDMTLTAASTLSNLDATALRFEGCSANFLNRISKVSCELKFAKDWIKRKNKAMAHVKDDQDCLLAQLDHKEAEILTYREKVWKSENKVRELEKLITENEEAMLALKEEKREAIRQLCVWIDYHRSQSDYYKKMISDMTVRSRKQLKKGF